MSIKELILLTSKTYNETSLISLLNKLGTENSDIALSETLAFKNSLLLNKCEMNNNLLNQVLLKNYILYLFTDKTEKNGNKHRQKLENTVLSGNIMEALNMLNNDIAVKYYLSYLYIISNKTNNARGILEIKESDYNKVVNLLEQINYITSYINSKDAENKRTLTKVKQTVSDR